MSFLTESKSSSLLSFLKTAFNMIATANLPRILHFLSLTDRDFFPVLAAKKITALSHENERQESATTSAFPAQRTVKLLANNC